MRFVSWWGINNSYHAVKPSPCHCVPVFVHHCVYVCVMSGVCDSQGAEGTVLHNGGSVCVWCQETRSHPSLVSSVFPDGRVRVRGKHDERTRPAGWHSFCHATPTTAPEAKFPALTGDTRALVGFKVREKECFMFSIPLYSHVPMLQPDEFKRDTKKKRKVNSRRWHFNL